MPTNKFFLDAAYAIALSAVTDQYHEKAEMLAKQIETTGTGVGNYKSSCPGNRQRFGEAPLP